MGADESLASSSCNRHTTGWPVIWRQRNYAAGWRVFWLVCLGQIVSALPGWAAEDLHERWADPRILLADVLQHVKASPRAHPVTDRSMATYCRPEVGFHQIHGLGMSFRSDPLNHAAPWYHIAVFEQGKALEPDGRVDTRALSISVEKIDRASRIKVRLCATRGYPIPTNLSVSLFDRPAGEFITKGKEVYPITFTGKFSNPIDVDGLDIDGVATFRQGLNYLLREILGEHGH